VNISEVRINVNKGGKVKAFAQVVIDGSFLVGDIRVLEGKEGTVYVAMPSRRLRNGSFRDIAHPLNTETRRHLDEAMKDPGCAAAFLLAGKMCREDGDPDRAERHFQAALRADPRSEEAARELRQVQGRRQSRAEARADAKK